MSGAGSRLIHDPSVNALNIFVVVTIICILWRVLLSIGLVAWRLPGRGAYLPLTAS